MTDPHNSSWLNSSLNCSDQRRSQISPSVPHPSTSRDRSYILDSQESVSSLPDKADPTTVTKTFRAGRKAAAQASLASRDKTPNAKSRRRRGRGLKNAGVCSEKQILSFSCQVDAYTVYALMCKMLLTCHVPSVLYQLWRVTAFRVMLTLIRTEIAALRSNTKIRTRGCWTNSLKRNWTARRRAASRTTSHLVRFFTDTSAYLCNM